MADKRDDDRVIDRWLRQALKERYAPALTEALPDAMLQLLAPAAPKR